MIDEAYNHFIPVYALDAKLNVITVNIPYDNLQWNRRYYDFGDFAIQIPKSVYDESWRYIGSPDRQEIGIINKVDKAASSNDLIELSGFFAEYLLNDKTCYPRFIASAQKAEKTIRDIFTKYKDDLNIKLAPANNPLLGTSYEANFSDNEMGDKFFSICQPDEMSYSVYYDYVDNQLYFKVWQGLDRTQSQTKNSFQTFSIEFGNIGEYAMTTDDSVYKNYAIIPCNGDANNVEQAVYYLDKSNGGYKQEIVFDMRGEKPQDGESAASFKQRILTKAETQLLAYQIVSDIEVEPVSDEGYMVDYDLGDKCDVVFSDIGVKAEVRIVEVLEVFKSTGHELTVGLGNKRIDNIRRAVTT